MAQLELTCAPAPEDVSLIGSALTAFNEDDVGPKHHMPIAVFIRDTEGKITGGLSGYTAWGWLYIQQLIVPETERGKGLAGKMLLLAEEEALGRGCHSAWIDTFNPAALKAYQRAGYAVFGELADFPTGRTRSFLQKRLATPQ
ncbi:GNAT family N-acetyltransferase [Oryzifoliimicrobium ureilyticus]|uniref:GNAT family N-acetyltransferase n=1 Tax=Oryzifoliimicrobium ureilyticus TaxID=3113724 RepID=UPI0030761604